MGIGSLLLWLVSLQESATHIFVSTAAEGKIKDIFKIMKTKATQAIARKAQNEMLALPDIPILVEINTAITIPTTAEIRTNFKIW